MLGNGIQRFYESHTNGLRCIFQGKELVGTGQSSWCNGIGLVEIVKQGYWNNSW